MFWLELEQLLLSKSADFKGQPDLVFQVCESLKDRKNETFWKVFSSLLTPDAATFTRDQLLQLLTIFDQTNGADMFMIYNDKYLSQQQKLEDNMKEVC